MNEVYDPETLNKINTGLIRTRITKMNPEQVTVMQAFLQLPPSDYQACQRRDPSNFDPLSLSIEALLKLDAYFCGRIGVTAGGEAHVRDPDHHTRTLTPAPEWDAPTVAFDWHNQKVPQCRLVSDATPQAHLNLNLPERFQSRIDQRKIRATRERQDATGFKNHMDDQPVPIDQFIPFKSLASLVGAK